MKTYNKQVYRPRNVNPQSDGGVHDSMYSANENMGEMNYNQSLVNKRGIYLSARVNKIEMSAGSLANFLSSALLVRFFGKK